MYILFVYSINIIYFKIEKFLFEVYIHIRKYVKYELNRSHILLSIFLLSSERKTFHTLFSQKILFNIHLLFIFIIILYYTKKREAFRVHILNSRYPIEVKYGPRASGVRATLFLLCGKKGLSTCFFEGFTQKWVALYNWYTRPASVYVLPETETQLLWRKNIPPWGTLNFNLSLHFVHTPHIGYYYYIIYNKKAYFHNSYQFSPFPNGMVDCSHTSPFRFISRTFQINYAPDKPLAIWACVKLFLSRYGVSHISFQFNCSYFLEITSSQSIRFLRLIQIIIHWVFEWVNCDPLLLCFIINNWYSKCIDLFNSNTVKVIMRKLQTLNLICKI